MPAFRSTDRRQRGSHLPIVLVAILAIVLAACGSAATPRPSTPPDATGSLIAPSTATAPPPSVAPSPSPAFPTTLTGADDVAVTLAVAPARIVSLTPAQTEILFALGAGDSVVGKVEDIANFPPEAKDVPVVATFNGVDIEKIVSLDADLVIAGRQRLGPRRTRSTSSGP